MSHVCLGVSIWEHDFPQTAVGAPSSRSRAAKKSYEAAPDAVIFLATYPEKGADLRQGHDTAVTIVTRVARAYARRCVRVGKRVTHSRRHYQRSA
jgi:hypothetical protein